MEETYINNLLYCNVEFCNRALNRTHDVQVKINFGWTNIERE